MLKAVGIVALVLVAAVLVIVGMALTRPGEFRVSRSIEVAAAPEKIFPMIEDFHAWSAWSPWEKLDPAMQRDYSGAAKGVGAVYAWKGDDKVGAGRMEIIDAAAPTKLVVKLDFTAPFPAHNTTTFGLEQKGESTLVTWTMEGPSPLIARIMGLFFSMDKMIGKDFETGLANLKAAAEG